MHYGTQRCRWHLPLTLSGFVGTERADRGELELFKQAGASNTADIGVKSLSSPMVEKHLHTTIMIWAEDPYPCAFSVDFWSLEKLMERLESATLSISLGSVSVCTTGRDDGDKTQRSDGHFHAPLPLMAKIIRWYVEGQMRYTDMSLTSALAT